MEDMIPALPAGPLDILQAIMNLPYPNEEDNGSAKVLEPKMKGEIKEVHQDQTKMQHINVKIERIKERIKERLLHTPKSIVNVSALETAKKIKELIQSRSSLVALDHQEYVQILQEMLSHPECKEEQEEFKANKDKGKEDKEKKW